MNPKFRKERIDRGINVRSKDIMILASLRDLLYVVLPRALVIIGIVIFPLMKDIIGSYWQNVMLTILVISLLALSWDLLAGVGLISLGQSFFFGIGGYFAGYLSYKFGLSPLITIPLATVGGSLVSTVLLYPILRLKGIYFGLITFAVPLLLQRIIETTKILGGTEGLSGITSISNRTFELYLVIFVVIITVYGFRRLTTSDYGLVFNAIRDNDRAVIASGYNIQWYKAQAVFISALPVSFAGAYFAHHFEFVGMSVFSLDYSILSLTGVIVGGAGTFFGAVLGSFILVPLSELLRGFGSLRVVIYSLMLLFFIIGLPEGLFSFFLRKYHQFERYVPMEESKSEIIS
ncbi:MAG: branched-chain amino acid ABC transporter permease [Thermincola sp.]|nr:branched-chain amino acid ABC transporter permease [Thermincola sp.]